MSSDRVGNAASSFGEIYAWRAVHPMSISRADPVMPEASSEQMNATHAAASSATMLVRPMTASERAADVTSRDSDLGLIERGL